MGSTWHIEDDGVGPLDVVPAPATTVSLQFIRSPLRRLWYLWLACALFAWYAVQVHQTTYLVDIGFSPAVAAWALGTVSVVAIPGQISFGALSDRVGREWVWSAGCFGFAICDGACSRTISVA